MSGRVPLADAGDGEENAYPPVAIAFKLVHYASQSTPVKFHYSSNSSTTFPLFELARTTFASWQANARTATKIIRGNIVSKVN